MTPEERDYLSKALLIDDTSDNAITGNRADEVRELMELGSATAHGMSGSDRMSSGQDSDWDVMNIS